MCWQEASLMTLKEEFVAKARGEGANMSQLCREYGICRKTGYKWLGRYQAEGRAGLVEQSRRPHHSPERTIEQVEQLVLAARVAHPPWGGRKLKRWLEDRGYQGIPAASTISKILRLHRQLSALGDLRSRTLSPCNSRCR